MNKHDEMRPPPTKKRRVVLPLFESSFNKPSSSSSSKRPRSSIPIPAFESAFGPGPSETRAAGSLTSATPKPTSAAGREKLRTHLPPVLPPPSHMSTSDPASLPNTTGCSPSRLQTPLCPLQPPSFGTGRCPETPLRTIKPPSLVAADRKTPLRVLKPPSLAIVDRRPETPLHSLKPLSAATPSKPLTAHRPHIHPNPTNAADRSGHSHTPLRVLKPPSLTEHQTPLRPLKPSSLTSSLTPATGKDAYKRLLHIFENEDTSASSHTVSIRRPVPPPPLHPQIARGFDLSPEKGSAGARERGRKHIRGGLAERAAHLLACSSTGFSLWRTELSQLLEVSGGRPPKADLRLRVVGIRDVMGTPGTMFTTCKTEGEEEEAEEERTVVFQLAEGESGKGVLKEGADVLVWRPWREVDVSDDVRHPELEEETPVPGRMQTGIRTVLLCSRFLVLPEQQS